jgi:prepilin peptidase CpaA
MPSFYPDPAFGWTFYAVLLGFLVVATYTDIGRLTIPKKLTLAMLAVGLVFSVVRGAWMGSLLADGDGGGKVWLFANTPMLGALDGLLCSLAGFATGFGIFLLLWFMGVMGGGDVKLMAALGAWVGPMQMLWLLCGAAVFYVLLGVVSMLRKLFRRGVQKTVYGVKSGAARDNLKKTPAGARRRDQLLAFSLPVALATGLLVPFLVARDDPRVRAAMHKTPPSEQASAQP